MIHPARNVPERLEAILGHALAGTGPDKAQCRYLLEFGEHSLEAGLTMATADHISRQRFGNAGVLLAQIGIETAPCPGRCRFCAFGDGHTTFPRSRLSMEEIMERARAFTADGDLFALFLMTMHDFDFARLLDVVAAVRRTIPRDTHIVVNIGDFDGAQAVDLRAAGVSGAYHVCRLREGVDTALDPAQRRRTFASIRNAGMDFYYCCEPIGPEHSSEELVEQIFLGIEHGCFQHAAMRRVMVPGAPLADRGQITERRLAHVVAVVTLASLRCAQTGNIAVHEPNLLGLAAGANAVYAETGANPRDTAADTSQSRGLDMTACRKMLYEAGFTTLLHGRSGPAPLSLENVLART